MQKAYVHSQANIPRQKRTETDHCCAWLDEPVKSELRRLSHRRPKLVVNVLSVKAQLVQHTDKESVFLLGVVLAFVRAVLNAQLVEWCTIASHLNTVSQWAVS